MAINRVELNDYMVFKGNFAAEFGPGINVIIGGNATGKTTLLRATCFNIGYNDFYPDIPHELYHRRACSIAGLVRLDYHNKIRIFADVIDVFDYVYIPEKDILEHAKGLLTFIDSKITGFGEVYRKVLISAQDTPTQEQSELQKSISQKIAGIIGGTVCRDEADGSYYTLKPDGSRIPFGSEASGYKKFGFLGLLVSTGQLEPGSILFWDEPENSLNPELVPELVEILLELSKNGVQIFIATHDYNLARYFDIRKDKGLSVMFHNLSKKDDGQIVCDSSPKYLGLTDNLLEKTGEELFNAVVADAMGVRQ